MGEEGIEVVIQCVASQKCRDEPCELYIALIEKLASVKDVVGETNVKCHCPQSEKGSAHVWEETDVDEFHLLDKKGGHWEITVIPNVLRDATVIKRRFIDHLTPPQR